MTTDEIMVRTKELAVALSSRGLIAEIGGVDTVRAANRDAEPPVDGAMSPGLRQAVVCRPDADGLLLWWWVWSGPTREAPREYEQLGPAADIDAAADRIVNVLRLDGTERERRM